jgi:hypothetical protein
LWAVFKNTGSQLNGRARNVAGNYRLGEILYGERANTLACDLPLRATLARYSHKQNYLLLNYLIGSDKKHGWDGQPDRLRGPCSIHARSPAALPLQGPIREIAFLIDLQPAQHRCRDVAVPHRSRRTCRIHNRIAAPGLSVIGSQLALVMSLSASDVPGFGPKPKQPFSVWKMTFSPGGR